jgi:hypothetical protein
VAAADPAGARGGTASASVSVAPRDLTPPLISNRTATPDEDGTVTVTWETNEPATSRVLYSTSADALSLEASDPSLVTAHRITLSGLRPSTTHHFRVESLDDSGNASTSPAAPAAPDTFTTPVARFIDSSVDHFGAGIAVDAHVGGSAAGSDGEVQLRPTIGEEFGGSSLPSGWSFDTWNFGGAATVSGGTITADGARVGPQTFFEPGRSLEFSARFGPGAFEHVGFGVNLSGPPWAIVSTIGDADAVYARTSNGSEQIDVFPGIKASEPHRYRIAWTGTGAEYWVDGARVITHPVPITASLRPLVSDYFTSGGTTTAHWLRMSPYAGSGTFTSRVLDTGSGGSPWLALEADSVTPAGTTIALATRAGDSPTPDASWSSWQPVAAGGAIASPAARYVQYQAVLTSSADDVTPTLERVDITYSLTP